MTILLFVYHYFYLIVRRGEKGYIYIWLLKTPKQQITLTSNNTIQLQCPVCNNEKILYVIDILNCFIYCRKLSENDVVDTPDYVRRIGSQYGTT